MRAPKPMTQTDYRAKLCENSKIQSKHVATLPRPGTSSPSRIQFHTAVDDGTTWITYLAPDGDTTSLTRQLYATNISTHETKELLQPGHAGKEDNFSLEEQLRRERARPMSWRRHHRHHRHPPTVLLPL
jgi:hypothetical protein